ncbi:MAG TPA: Clp protease N-terminal domain-containing protein [Galbitalea sp.]|jgi:ATP-dependent Clp protease ATP-binding subunit ClpA|nr:Clp protease N-terminal domain-containing protein [Galbitalea sp.]
MTEFPIPLDNLIAYVRSMHSSGGPLDNLTDAVRVAASIEEQSDALIGYFVDQARHAGAPWSEIGASMGVSKQAVQKRFVVRIDADDIDADSAPFSRFTMRARHVVRFARVIASTSGSTGTSAEHLAVALVSEPEAVAARVIHGASVTDSQLCETFGIELPPTDTVAPAEGEVPFTDGSKTALREALKAALRLGHNYIGTEHILLGLVRDAGDVSTKFEGLGLTVGLIESAVTAEVDKLKEGLGGGPA